MRAILTYILLLYFCASSVAQKESTPLIDSLKNLASSNKVKIEQVDIYNKIAFQYLFLDTIQALAYIDTAKTISEEVDYSQGIARSINIHAIHNSFQGRNEQGIALNKEALTYCKEDDFKVKGKIHNGLGLAYQKQYIVDKSLDHYHKALHNASQVKDTLTMSVILGNIAGINSTQDNHVEAKKYFLQLEKIASHYDNQNVQFAFHIRFGEYLTQREEYEESNEVLSRALINAETLNHFSKIRKVKLQLAINNLNQGNFELSENYLNNLISPDLRPNDLTFMRYQYWMADLEHSRKNYFKAINHANVGLDKIEQSNDYYFYMPRLLRILHESEFNLKNYENAYSYLSQLKSWQDSLELKERENKFIELESKYQSEKKEIENALLKEQSLSKNTKIRERTTLAIGSLLTLILSLLLAYLLFKNTIKEKSNNILLESRVAERTRKLKKSNEELERFAYIASHDLKEPTTTIMGFVNLLRIELPPEKTTETIDKYISFIEKSSHQMLYLIEGILEYTKLGNNVSKTSVNLNEILEKAKVNLYQTINEKKAVILSDNLPTIYCNSIVIFQIFKNLIENGLKFNESSIPTIQIECDEHSDHIVLHFIDNGIGIDTEYQDRVFEMFARLNNRSKYDGTGLGLSIVKKLSTLMEGDIKLVQSNNNGSTFSLKIPLRNPETTN